MVPAPDWRAMANDLALVAGELTLVARLAVGDGTAGKTASQLEAAVEKMRTTLDGWLEAEQAARAGIPTDADLAELNAWFAKRRTGGRNK